MMKIARLQILAGATILGLTQSAHAWDGSLNISASVLKHVSMQVVARPDSVVVTADDLARGYVDVPGTAQFTVRSNTSDGYLLVFTSSSDFFDQALVSGLESDVQLGPNGGDIAQNAIGKGLASTALGLGFRFVLSASAQQGVYAWPMGVSAAPR